MSDVAVEEVKFDLIRMRGHFSQAIEQFTKSQLVAMLAETRTKLNEFKSINERAIDLIKSQSATKTDVYFGRHWSYISRGELRRNGYSGWGSRDLLARDNTGGYWQTSGPKASQTYTHIDPDGPTQSLIDIKYMLDKVTDFEKSLKRGKLRKDSWFPYWGPQPYNKAEMGWITISSVDRIDCERCGSNVKMATLASHQQRVRCKDQAYRKQLQDRGLHRIYKGDKLHTLGLNGVIEGIELVAVEYEVYVPTWIKDAATLYEKDAKTRDKSDGDGEGAYAGMSLEEFLQKMGMTKASESSSQPQVFAGRVKG